MSKLSIASLRGTALCNILGVLAGIGSGVTLARTLGPVRRGEFAAALLWPWLLVLLADLGLGFAFSYSAAKLEQRFNDLFTLAVAAGTLLGCVAIGIGWILLRWVTVRWSPAAHDAMSIALLSIPFVLVGGYIAYMLLGRQLVSEFNAIRLFTSLVYTTILLVLAAAGRVGLRSYALGYLVAQVLACLFAYAMVLRHYRPRFHFTSDLLPGLFSYGLKTHLASLAAQTNLRLDQAVMSLIFTAQQLGFYVVAVAISGALGPFFNALAVFLLPKTTHAVDAASGVILTARYVKLAIVLSLPLLLAVIVVMPWILPLLFGQGFGPAILPARILVVASLFQGLNTVLGNSLRGLSKPASPAWAEGAGMVITCILLAILLPLLGVTGAAITSLAAYGIASILLLRFLAQAGTLELRHLVAVPIDFPVLRSLRFAGKTT